MATNGKAAMIATFNAYHLGDNLVHLHFMRKLALAHPDKTFGHYANAQHGPQLRPILANVPNLELLETCPTTALNAWRGHEGFWHQHQQRSNFVLFHLDWFDHLAKKMGLENPIRNAADMRFDYAALAAEQSGAIFDVLVINSIPHSGQFGAFNLHEMTNMVQTLLSKGKSVITTYPTGLCESTHNGTTGKSITGIGALSYFAKSIVGVVTGPSWPCMNIWNLDKKFIWMLDDERVDLMPNTVHVHSVKEALAAL